MNTKRIFPMAALAFGLAFGGLFVRPASATDQPTATAPAATTYKVSVSGMT